MIEKIKAYLGNSKLTRSGLVKLGLVVLAFFFSVALVISFFAAEISKYDQVVLLYQQGQLKAAEKKLVELLAEDDSRQNWLLLVRGRGSAKSANRSTGRDLDLNIKKNTEFFLTEQQFIDLLKKSESMSFASLQLWYNYSQAGFKPIEVTYGDKNSAILPADQLKELAFIAHAAGRLKMAVPWAEKALAKNRGDKQLVGLVMNLYLQQNNLQAVDQLLAEDKNRELIEPRFLTDYYLRKGQYIAMAGALFRGQVNRYQADFVIACLFVALAWLLVVLHLGRFTRFSIPEKGLAFLALVLGVASAYFCLCLVLWQDHLIDYDNKTKNSLFHLGYAIMAIGLREEFSKLLFVLLLSPLLVRIQKPLTVLTICSLVGLGFAVEENFNYFMQAGGSGVLGRFLTANFFHLTLTGAAGFALVQVLQKKKPFMYAVEYFLIVIIVHGLYDFFLIDPAMAELSFIAMAIYIVVTQQYLRLIQEITLPAINEEYWPVTRTFVFALSWVIGTSYVLLASQVGLALAFELTFLSLLGIGIISIVFFREFNERVY